MAACIYCNKKLGTETSTVDLLKRKYPVCDSHCSNKAAEYIQADKKYKKIMYLGIFIPCITIIFFLVFASKMKLIYMMQAIVGLVFILFPYPINIVDSYERVGIKNIKLMCKLIGVFFLIFGLYLMIAL